MKTKLHAFLNKKNIPFKELNFGLQINSKHYNYDDFKHLDIFQLDETFIVNYQTNN